MFCIKNVVKKFVKHAGKILCRSPFFVELLVFSQQLYQERASSTDVLFRILGKKLKHVSYRTRAPGKLFWKINEFFLKTNPIGIVNNISNAIYQKR